MLKFFFILFLVSVPIVMSFYYFITYMIEIFKSDSQREKIYIEAVICFTALITATFISVYALTPLFRDIKPLVQGKTETVTGFVNTYSIQIPYDGWVFVEKIIVKDVAYTKFLAINSLKNGGWYKITYLPNSRYILEAEILERYDDSNAKINP